MTLKEYLEKEIRHWAKAKKEAPIDSSCYWKADGRIMACTDLILTCSDDVLNKKITNEVW